MILSICCLVLALSETNIDKAMYAIRTEGAEAAKVFLSNHSESSPFEFGLDILRTGDHKAAFEWFEIFLESEGLDLYELGLSNVYFSQGDFDKSISIVEKILRNDPPPIVEAKALHLKARIQLNELKVSSSLKTAEISLVLFEELGNDLGRYKVRLLLGAIYATQKKFTPALQYVREGVQINEKSVKPGILAYAWEVKSEIFWHKGELNSSLNWARKAELEYLKHGMFNNAWFLKWRVGYLLAFLGRHEAAEVQISEMDAIAVGAEKYLLRMYNSIALLFINKCQGKKMKERVFEFDNWRQQNKLPIVESLSRYLNALPCPSPE